MPKFLAAALAAVGLYGAVDWWRRNRRFGADFVNRVVDPWLVRKA